jgi:pimeloyl-ACP methyl ester carboxylesterase
MKELHNARVSLALHTLQGGAGLPLLLLHELGGSAADFSAHALAWQGPIHALDLSGHGHSGRVYGGGYYPELWTADADLALAELGQAVVLGAGLGAYVALLLAGGRPTQVCCAVLCPGAGLSGGGATPRFPPEAVPPDIPATPAARALQRTGSTDPNVLAGQDLYVRPPDYAARFAASARRIVLLEDGAPRPPWWLAVSEITGVERFTGSREALHEVLAIARAAVSARGPKRA